MNKIKKLILIFFSVILTLATSGCIFNKEPSTKELALQYLSNKYNDNFTLCGYLSKSWAYSYETITYYSEKYSDKVIVYVYGDKGDYSYKDNYYMLSMKTMLKIILKNSLKNMVIQLKLKLNLFHRKFTTSMVMTLLRNTQNPKNVWQMYILYANQIIQIMIWKL